MSKVVVDHEDILELQILTADKALLQGFLLGTILREDIGKQFKGACREMLERTGLSFGAEEKPTVVKDYQGDTLVKTHVIPPAAKPVDLQDLK
jgi:hypothetical protein